MPGKNGLYYPLVITTALHRANCALNNSGLEKRNR